MTNTMQWSNALSTRPSLEAAVEEVVARSRQSLTAAPDVGIVFISSAFASEYTRLLPLLQERLQGIQAIVGCSGGGVIGMVEPTESLEAEDTPALSLMLACLPGVKVHPFHISLDDLPDLDSPPDRWVSTVGVSPAENPQFVLFTDPLLSKINDLLQGLDFAYPTSNKVGGVASTTSMGDRTGLFCQGRFYAEGAVGLALSGNIVMETIVAQGCRPIGQPYRITKGERNILLGIAAQEVSEDYDVGDDSETPLDALRALIQSLSEADRQLAQRSLFVGVVRDEFKQNLQQGDFLIRNLIGVDPRVGAIAVGDRLRVGQRIQFHLRDARTSAEDLEVMLQRYQQQTAGASHQSVAALMFSCLGRGRGLYDMPNFDSDLFRQYLGNLPIAGFFCSGEIGPVGGETCLHGYTSVFGIFRQP